MAKAWKTVLLVDDSRLFLDFEREMLEPWGCRVREAISFKDAEAALREEKPDLVLLDLTLPDRSGAQLCRLMKSNPALASIPVIMVSASERIEDVQACINAGCDDYLSKPIHADVLRAKVGRALGVAARRSLRVPIQIKVMKGEEGAFFGYTRDLSETGIALVADEPVEISRRVEIHFRDPHTSHRISCRAVVRRVAPMGPSQLLGLAFEELGEADRLVLRRIVGAVPPEGASCATPPTIASSAATTSGSWCDSARRGIWAARG